MKTLPILTETVRTKISRLLPVLWKWFTAAYRIMATKTSGMMTTKAWAEVKAARAVEPDDVDDATVPTSARPMTISNSTNRIFIFLRSQASEQLNIFAINIFLSMVVKESDC